MAVSRGMIEQAAHADAVRAELQASITIGAPAWSAADIKARLVEAADTLRRLPFPKNGAPARVRGVWPDVVRESFDQWVAYDRNAPPRLRLAAASIDAIGRLDETLGWLHWITDDQRKIVWGRACNLSWRRLQDIDGRCERTLKNRHQSAISVILQKLLKKDLPALPVNGMS